MPKSSELSISSASEFKTSGLAISFGKTLRYLPRKTVTRRVWKDKHAQKFINAFHHNKLVKALDKDIRYGGQQIGWCRLLCAPYKEQLAAMPDADLQAEGGMCESVEAFIHQYFKGDRDLEVWVIRFEFMAADKLTQIQTAILTGVYSDLAIKGNSNSPTTSLAASIHQAPLLGLDIYADFIKKTDSNSVIASATKSIHQASFNPLGVYSVIQNKTNCDFSIALSIDNIHQSLLEHQTALDVYQSNDNKVNRKVTISLPLKSIHQTPVIQGGSGLVYVFWKGESIVNHYRYKVKINGKWKVKSLYIPVGKLPKVREAIANKLGVAAIVTQVLARQLLD